MMNKSIMVTRNKDFNGNILILGAFFSLFFLFADIGINVAWGGVLLVIVLAVTTILLSHKIRIRFSNAYFALLIFAVTILVNIRNSAILISNPFYFFSMLLVLVVFPMSYGNMYGQQKLLKVLLFFSLLIAAIPIISSLFPAYYKSISFTLISEDSQLYNFLLLNQGYSATVGANISLTSNYIVIGLFIAFSRYSENKKKRYLVMVLYFIISLLSINRRGEFIACALALFIGIFIYLSHKKRKAILMAIGVIVPILAFVMLCLVNSGWSYSGDNRLLSSVGDLIAGKDISNGRFDLYKIAFDLFCENPLFGIGWGNYKSYGSLIIPQITNVHNIYVQLLCELGIFGALIVLYVLVFLLKNTCKAFLANKKLRFFAPQYFAFLMVLYILILGLFDNPIFQDTFWLLLSLIVFCSDNNRGDECHELRSYFCRRYRSTNAY